MCQGPTLSSSHASLAWRTRLAEDILLVTDLLATDPPVHSTLPTWVPFLGQFHSCDQFAESASWIPVRRNLRVFPRQFQIISTIHRTMLTPKVDGSRSCLYASASTLCLVAVTATSLQGKLRHLDPKCLNECLLSPCHHSVPSNVHPMLAASLGTS